MTGDIAQKTNPYWDRKQAGDHDQNDDAFDSHCSLALSSDSAELAARHRQVGRARRAALRATSVGALAGGCLHRPQIHAGESIPGDPGWKSTVHCLAGRVVSGARSIADDPAPSSHGRRHDLPVRMPGVRSPAGRRRFATTGAAGLDAYERGSPLPDSFPCATDLPSPTSANSRT